MRLAELRDSSGLLINLIKLVDGVDLSIFSVFLPLTELRQESVHIFFSFALLACLTADGLVSSGFLRYEPEGVCVYPSVILRLPSLPLGLLSRFLLYLHALRSISALVCIYPFTFSLRFC